MSSSEKIKKIVEQLTLEEKATLCSGMDFWHLAGVERVGIRPMMVADGPHGLRKQDDQGDHLGVNDSIKAVCYPAGCATACSFDQGLLEKMGSALGESCQAEGVGVLLGPAINIKRSPLCGRNFEYLSEDPYLAGKLAASMVRGVQSWNVGTSVKHFAANNQEYRRMSISSDLSERTLREIYLPAFETAVKEGKPWTMMCSYNRINGVYASQNRKLLTEILREEWGFDGFVMSDWWATSDNVAAIEAGLDLEMPGPCPKSIENLIHAVNDGRLSEPVLDQAVERILTIVSRWQEGDRPEAVFDREAQHNLAGEIEKECAVLMKNNGVLPLSRQAKVAYIGCYGKTPRYQGGGSSHINASKVTGALEFAPEQTVYVTGFVDDREEDSQRAVEAARQADVAVIFAGLPDSFESEGYDRSHMRLPDCQNELIARIAAVQKNTVVVLHCGSPVELPWCQDVGAILCMYLGGEDVGRATDALLYGDNNPCGRLAETWPIQLQDNPSYLNFPGLEASVPYAEGVYVGYRYYDAKNMAVRFPFGHGESYTTFAYGAPILSKKSMKEGETVEVTVEVTNTGTVYGKEVVQLYVASHAPQRPLKELKGFAKVGLEPGETKAVSFTLDSRSLSYYEEALGDWYAASGTYDILVGHSSRDIRCQVALEYTTQRFVPFPVSRDTAVGQVLANPITAAVLAKYRTGKNIFMQDSGEDSAVSEEMGLQMMINAPLRQLAEIEMMPEGALEQLIAELQSVQKL